jgi:Kef-type K+ transport system membrane component KefB
VANESRESYYCYMNSISIFLYAISVIMWWAGFNYAAARANTTRRRKLFSTAAALALAWPFAFIALAAALATKAAANIMIAVGNHINNTWDAAISDEDDTTIVTKLTPMGTAVRVRRDNTEHDTDTANSGYEGSDIETTTGEETHPALADNTILMPPPPPATNEADGDTTDQADTGSDEATQATEKDTDADDETVTIQKVALSDLL